MAMQRVRAVQPFVGSFRCAPEMADYTQAEWREDPTGAVIKTVGHYRKVAGRVQTSRSATDADRQEDESRARAAEAAGVPYQSRLMAGGQFVLVEADPPYIEVPEEYARDLIARGLAEPYDPPPRPIAKRRIGAQPA